MDINLIKNGLSRVSNYKEKVYLVTLAISLTTMILSNTVLVEETIYSFAPTIYFILKLIRYLTYIVFMILIAIDFFLRKTNKYLVPIIIMCGGLVTLFSRDFQIFSYIIIIVAAANIDIKKILKVYLYIQSILLMCFILMSSLGIVEDFIFDIGVRNRHALGFIWTTLSPMIFFFVICNIVVIYDRKIEIVEIFMLIILGSTLYLLTDARFIFLMQLLLIMIILIYQYFYKLFDKIFTNSVIEKLIICLPFILFVLSFILQWLYDSNNIILIQINNLLSGRLELGHNAIMNYGMSLFGKPIEWIGYTIGFDGTQIYNYVDCSYTQILLNYGIFIILFALIAYSVLLKYSLLRKKYNFVIVIIAILILSITEPRLINIVFNPFIISSSIFFKSK